MWQAPYKHINFNLTQSQSGTATQSKSSMWHGIDCQCSIIIVII